ncbi:MAG: hypothetical protein ACFFDN_31560, partial [Candidatus Hodarchaeota archaeon]
MSPKKYLSNKKTAQQTISISPALKDWIQRYTNVNRKKNPNDDRFKSVSAFYNYVLEKVMVSLEQGKTLDDFDRFIDSEISSFFDKLTFKAAIPIYENATESNRYNGFTFNQAPYIFMALRKAYAAAIDPYDHTKIPKLFDRFNKFFMSNKNVKDSRLEVVEVSKKKQLIMFLEYTGIHRNIMYENCKFNAAAIGFLGGKITECIYSEKELYCRLNFITTDLFYRKDLAKKERIELMKHNVSYLINHNRILKDKDYFIWSKLAQDKNLIISFRNIKDIQRNLN